MPGQNIIDLGYDMEKLTAQQKVMVGYFTQTLELAEQLDGRKIAPDISGQKEMNDSLGKQKKVLDDLALTVKEYNSILSQTATAQAKQNASSSTAAENLAIEREQLRQRNAELKAGAQYLTAESNSIDEAKAKVKLLTDERNKLNLTTTEGKKRQAELNVEINKNNEFIRANVSLLEQQKINIGNYAGSFKEAFTVLEKELAGVRAQLQKMNPSDAGFDKLAQEEKLLTQLSENLNKSFGSTRQELRAFSEAAKQMGLQLGQTDQIYMDFVQNVGGVKREIEDVQKTLSFQASDTKYIDGVVSAVHGLAGAYGVGASAAALFADGDEKVQKEMAKMQAILTLVTSLQAVLNAVQTENGAVQIALETKTKLLNAAELITSKIKAALVVETQAQTVATVEQTVATEAAVIASAEQAVANEAVAVSAGEATVAMGAEAAATGAAEAATVSFATAFAATGIGAIIIALAAGIAYLAKKTYDWIEADEIAIKNQQKINTAIKDVNEAIQSREEIYKTAIEQNRKSLENELSNAEKSGLSQERIFAIKKKLNQYDIESSQESIKRNGITVASLTGMEKKWFDAANNVKYYADEIANFKKKNPKEDVPDLLQKQFDLSKQEAEISKGTFEYQKGIWDKSTAAQKEAAETQVEESKFNAEEKRKIILESTRLEADLILAKDNSILNNEKSTLGERLKALQSSAEARKKVIQAEENDVLKNPGSSGADKRIAIKKAGEEEKKLNIETQDLIFKLKEDYRKRDLSAQLNSDKEKLSADIKLKDAFAANDVFSFETRTKALNQSLEDQKQIIEKDYAFQLATKVMTDKEREDLEIHYQTQISQLMVDGELKRVALAKSAFDKLKQDRAEDLQDIDRYEKSLINKDAERYSLDIVALNNSLRSKSISLREYNKERQKIDGEYFQKSISSAIEASQAQLAELNKYTLSQEQMMKLQGQLVQEQWLAENDIDEDKKRKHAEEVKRLQDLLKAQKDYVDKKEVLTKTISDSELKQAEYVNKKEIELRQTLKAKEQELMMDVLGIAKEAFGARFEYEKNLIADRETKQQEAFANEVDRIKSSSLNDQEKAAQLKILDEERRKEKEKNDQDQKKIDIEKAKFERDVSVINIGIKTAEAVAASSLQASILASNPLTAALAPMALAQIPIEIGIGIAQTAAVLAKPLPKYAEGTENHPGGYAMVGEGKNKELVTTPSGESFIADRPMILDLPSGTMVQPFTNDDINDVMYNGMLRKTSQMLNISDQLESRRMGLDSVVGLKIDNMNKNVVRAIREIKSSTSVTNNINLGWSNYIQQEIYK